MLQGLQEPGTSQGSVIVMAYISVVVRVQTCSRLDFLSIHSLWRRLEGEGEGDSRLGVRLC